MFYLLGYCLALLVFAIYYYFIVARLPVLRCSSTKFKSFLKEHVPILSEKYSPTIWCAGPRFQTVLAFLLCSDLQVPYKRELLDLTDGGQVALDWLHPKSENARTPIILILPGYTGTSESPYAQKFAINAHECNFRCAIFNYRGLAGVPLKTPKLYSANDTTDLVHVVTHIRKRFPDAVLGACGVSMGSLLLAHYLIKYSDQREISIAMINNTLFDIAVANRNLKSGLDSFFNWNLVRYMLNIVKRFEHILDAEDSPWSMEEVMKCKTVQEFDNCFTRKMFGYESVHAYYEEVNISDKIDKIKIPLLCLNAADDPSQPFKYAENDDSPVFDNEQVAVLITAAGGHIAHLEGLWPFRKKTTYMHRLFVQYFSAMFRNDSYKQFLNMELM